MPFDTENKIHYSQLLLLSCSLIKKEIETVWLCLCSLMQTLGEGEELSSDCVNSRPSVSGVHSSF